MATSLSRIPFFLSIPSHDKVIFHHHLQYRQWNQCSSSKRFTVCFASSIRRPRLRKKVKSDEELRHEIMEFVSVAGFPEGYVPSLKDLSEHGRNDLVNIVRRRGYKLIRELLACSNTVNGDEFAPEKLAKEEPNPVGGCVEDTLTGQDETMNIVKEELSPREDSSTHHFSSTSDDTTYLKLDNNRCQEENQFNTLATETDVVNDVVQSDYSTICSEENEASIFTSMNQEVNGMVKYVHPVVDVPVHEHYTSPDLNYGNNARMSVEPLSSMGSEETRSGVMNGQDQIIDDMAEKSSGGLDNSQGFVSDDKDCKAVESSVALSIEDKVARFIQNGNLDSIEDISYGTLHESQAEETGEDIGTQDEVKIQPRTGGQEHLEFNYSSTQSVGVTSNGSVFAAKDSAHVATVNNNRDDCQRAGNANSGVDSLPETVRKENQVEINRLKFLLHQKEMELSRLKEQIEREKVALSVMQKKAETEILKAQKLISDKDAELNAAEESLSGLQEVEIEYCGDGNVVEVTGSFNGWQHRIVMEPQPSNTTGSSESRKQRCWSTLLWLYPGTYEMKFIVDGQWRTDPQKESITKGHITNNILKVER